MWWSLLTKEESSTMILHDENNMSPRASWYAQKALLATFERVE